MSNIIYAGKNIIQGLMKNVLSVAPSSTLTEDDVQELWDNTLDHDHMYTPFITINPTCTEAGLKTYTCSICGHSYTEEIPALGHDFGEFVTDVEATCDTAGSKSQHCSRCDATQNVIEIPAWGHDYEEPVYTWSDDNSTCTASRTCVTDGYVDTETVNVSLTMKEATCSEAGVKTYTAEFTNGAFAKQMKNETIDALGHNFINRVCTNCGLEVAPDGELSNWNYTLDEENKTVTLNYYTGSATNVTVYGKYQLNNNIYNTKIASNDSNAKSNYMFSEKSSIQTITFKEGIDTSNVTSMYFMFNNCKALTTINGLEYLDTSNVTIMSNMFRDCTSLLSLDLTSFDTSKVRSMKSMFYNCSALTSLDVSGFNTSNVISMAYMFCKCTALTSLDVSGFDTSNVTDMKSMFDTCNKLTSIIGLENFDTSNVTNVSYMFYECNTLTSLDLTSFDTSKVTNMFRMFSECTSLISLDLTSFDTSNVTDMNSMFGGCKVLISLDLTSFNTSNVTNMEYMFSGCNTLTSLDLTSFDTSNVTTMNCMFNNCSAITEIKVTTGKWVIASGCNTSYMFYDCGVSAVTPVAA